MDMIVGINRRLTALESILTTPVQQAIYGVFKCQTSTTKGDVYIQTTTKNLIEMTTTEGDANPVVIAAERMVDGVGYGMVWTKCAIMGLIWVNFETGLSPTPRDYVITSATEGLAKTVSGARSGVFGRLIRFDAANDRGLVMIDSGGGGVAIPIVDCSSAYPSEGYAQYDMIWATGDGTIPILCVLETVGPYIWRWLSLCTAAAEPSIKTALLGEEYVHTTSKHKFYYDGSDWLSLTGFMG